MPPLPSGPRPPVEAERPTRRDRRGRGPRGPLLPADAPAATTRTERFDDLVLDAVERLESGSGPAARLAGRLDVIVGDVPAPGEVDPDGRAALGRVHRDRRGEPIALVVHRRALERRVPAGPARSELVGAVVAELLSDVLGLAPEDVDPDYPFAG